MCSAIGQDSVVVDDKNCVDDGGDDRDVDDFILTLRCHNKHYKKLLPNLVLTI